MAAPESAAIRAAGVTAISIQQITFRSKDTLFPSLRGDPSPGTVLRQLPCLVTTSRELPLVEPLSPAVHEFPPYQFCPLLEVRFGPLAVTPPLHAKLAGIEGGCDAVVRRQNPVEDAECPPGVEIGSDEQNAANADALETAGHILSLISGGVSINWTNRNRARLRQAFDILPSQSRLIPLVKFGIGWSIENQPRCVTLIEQLYSPRRTPVGFSGKNDYHV